MATNHTEHYGLSQWEATDAVLRTDFNEDNAKIDAELARLQREKTNESTFGVIVDTLGETNGRLNDLTARVEALEAKM